MATFPSNASFARPPALMTPTLAGVKRRRELSIDLGGSGSCHDGGAEMSDSTDVSLLPVCADDASICSSIAPHTLTSTLSISSLPPTSLLFTPARAAPLPPASSPPAAALASLPSSSPPSYTDTHPSIINARTWGPHLAYKLRLEPAFISAACRAVSAIRATGTPTDRATRIASALKFSANVFHGEAVALLHTSTPPPSSALAACLAAPDGRAASIVLSHGGVARESEDPLALAATYALKFSDGRHMTVALLEAGERPRNASAMLFNMYAFRGEFESLTPLLPHLKSNECSLLHAALRGMCPTTVAALLRTPNAYSMGVDDLDLSPAFYAFFPRQASFIATATAALPWDIRGEWLRSITPAFPDCDLNRAPCVARMLKALRGLELDVSFLWRAPPSLDDAARLDVALYATSTPELWRIILALCGVHGTAPWMLASLLHAPTTHASRVASIISPWSDALDVNFTSKEGEVVGPPLSDPLRVRPDLRTCCSARTCLCTGLKSAVALDALLVCTKTEVVKARLPTPAHVMRLSRLRSEGVTHLLQPRTLKRWAYRRRLHAVHARRATPAERLMPEADYLYRRALLREQGHALVPMQQPLALQVPGTPPSLDDGLEALPAACVAAVADVHVALSVGERSECLETASGTAAQNEDTVSAAAVLEQSMDD